MKTQNCVSDQMYMKLPKWLQCESFLTEGCTQLLLLLVFPVLCFYMFETLTFWSVLEDKSELFELQCTQQFLHLNSFLEKKLTFPKSERMMAKHLEKVLQLWASVLFEVQEKLLPCKNNLRFNLKSLCSHQESATVTAWLAHTAASGGLLSLLLHRIFFMNSLFWL